MRIIEVVAPEADPLLLLFNAADANCEGCGGRGHRGLHPETGALVVCRCTVDTDGVIL